MQEKLPIIHIKCLQEKHKYFLRNHLKYLILTHKITIFLQSNFDILLLFKNRLHLEFVHNVYIGTTISLLIIYY